MWCEFIHGEKKLLYVQSLCVYSSGLEESASLWSLLKVCLLTPSPRFVRLFFLNSVDFLLLRVFKHSLALLQSSSSSSISSSSSSRSSSRLGRMLVADRRGDSGVACNAETLRCQNEWVAVAVLRADDETSAILLFQTAVPEFEKAA